MKIPFDIKFRPQIESGEYKVETRDGRLVRIICWDRVAKENTDDDLNICVLVPEHNGEAVYYYHQSGKKWVSDKRFDLFIITPESEFVTSFQQEQPEVQNGKFVFPKYLYARTKDSKTIDMSYAPQDMTAVEYIRNDFVEQEQPEVQVIQWTGHNLKEVIDFTGKSPKFGEWFKSWEDFESYVHSHGDILKLFSEDGSHFEVPVGAWIVQTPDGYNVPSVARFIHAKQVQPEVNLDKEIEMYISSKGLLDYAFLVPSIARHFAEWGAIHLNARKEEEI